MSVETSRRTFLVGIAKGMLPAVLGTSGFLPLLNSRADAAFIAVVAAVTATLQVVSSFVQRPNGLADMMRAVNEKLDLIIAEITVIENALAQIVEAMARLEQQIPEFIREGFVEDKVGRLRAATAAWLDSKITSRSEATGLNEFAKSMLATNLSDIDKLIYDLSTNETGAIPQAAMVVPLALGVHLNILSLFYPQKIGNALTRHIKWHDNILSLKVSKSVQTRREILVRERERLLNDIAKSTLGSSSTFDRVTGRSGKIGLVKSCVSEFEPEKTVKSCSGELQQDCYFNTIPSKRGRTDEVIAAWQMIPLTSEDFTQIGLQYSIDAKVPDWASSIPAEKCKPVNVSFRDTAALRQATRSTPPVSKVDAEIRRFLEPDKDTKASGLIPRLNELSARIYFLDRIIEMVSAARAEAVRMKESFPT